MLLKKLKITLSLFAIISFVLYSCADDDICDSITTPRLRFALQNEAGADVPLNPLYIDRKNADGTITKKVEIKENKIALNALNDATETTFYFYTDDKATEADKDIIKVTYNTELEFLSKACGYKLVYKNVSYELVQAKKFKKIIPKSPVIYDELQNDLLIIH